jgi:hypothetical protein
VSSDFDKEAYLAYFRSLTARERDEHLFIAGRMAQKNEATYWTRLIAITRIIRHRGSHTVRIIGWLTMFFVVAFIARFVFVFPLTLPIGYMLISVILLSMLGFIFGAWCILSYISDAIADIQRVLRNKS